MSTLRPRLPARHAQGTPARHDDPRGTSPANSAPLLDVRKLSCGHGERALFAGLDLQFGPGTVARVLGDNGAGKTTLLRTLAGLHWPLSGTVRWQSSDASGEALSLRDCLCFIGHDNALNGALSPVENLFHLMRLAGRPIARAQIGRTLDELGLRRIRHKACSRLSSGQKRRVSLARLWLGDAPLWLLDEPASALDVAARAMLTERIEAHSEAGGIVVYTTHEPLPFARLAPDAVELPAC